MKILISHLILIKFLWKKIFKKFYKMIKIKKNYKIIWNYNKIGIVYLELIRFKINYNNINKKLNKIDIKMIILIINKLYTMTLKIKY